VERVLVPGDWDSIFIANPYHQQSHPDPPDGGEGSQMLQKQ